MRARAYASNDELRDEIDALARGACRGRARALELGASARGDVVRALEVGEASASGSERERWSGRMRFGFIGNMHGDEPVGREIAMAIARWVCERSGEDGDALARRLTREATLFFVPTMNPDGFAARTRGNARGVDLNRNFPPARFAMPKSLRDRGGGGAGANSGDAAERERETELIMRWSKLWGMNAAINYHEGALVANYPWDGNADGSTSYSASPDDETFRYLAQTYANSHPTMNQSTEFKGGITNGAEWYPLWGGMQDWHYVNTGTYDITVEVDDQKWPQEELLPNIVAEHVQASLEMCSRALFGSVRGFVYDAKGVGIAGATVTVGSSGLPVTTDAKGFFAKPSAPTNQPVRVVVTPPASSRRLPVITRIIDSIDPENGASIDVFIVPSSRLGALSARGFVLLAILAILFVIRRAIRRRRRVAALSESIANNADVEKAIANRRGTSKAPFASASASPRAS